MSKQNRDFEIFKAEFDKYKTLFGLTGFKVFYEYCPIENRFADIHYSLDDCAVHVRLNSEPPPMIEGYTNNIRGRAKHEALHLFLSRLVWHASRRFVTEEVLDEAEEEIVIKLEELIP